MTKKRTQIEFVLKGGRGTGLSMSMVPCDAEGEPAADHYLHIPEAAFGLVELCIVENWPSYANYGHWGISRIPMETWRKVSARVAALQKEILSAKSSADLPSLRPMFPTLEKEFKIDFDPTQRASVDLLGQILTLSSEWSSTYDWVQIEGV